MKKYALAVMILLCPFLYAQANIINGFLQEKFKLEKDIRKMVELLNDKSTEKAQKQIEKQLKHLRKEYELVSKEYAQTAELLATFEYIDPELFARVSKVTNAEGTLTHVYVRYVNRSSEEFTYFTNKYFTGKGYTSVRQSLDNQHVCTSFYGANTITIGFGCDEKYVLGHEFAHVLYIVPNLNAYTYFMKYRNKKLLNAPSHGHGPNDPSFVFVKSVEDRFVMKYNNYLSRTKNNDSFRQNTALKN